MSSTPYQRMALVPITNLDEFRKDVRQHRLRYKDGEDNRNLGRGLLERVLDTLQKRCKSFEGQCNILQECGSDLSDWKYSGFKKDIWMLREGIQIIREEIDMFSTEDEARAVETTAMPKFEEAAGTADMSTPRHTSQQRVVVPATEALPTVMQGTNIEATRPADTADSRNTSKQRAVVSAMESLTVVLQGMKRKAADTADTAGPSKASKR